MIALDTNVLARYLLNDDQAQAAEAERLLETATSRSPWWRFPRSISWRAPTTIRGGRRWHATASR